MVSIHAPRVGCDCGGGRRAIYAIPFQFTHPVWGATQSEHCTPCRSTFQFTHPVWGATHSNGTTITITAFQFTHPVWGATIDLDRVEAVINVSIHAPRVGCDPQQAKVLKSEIMFQFTHPVWGATPSKQRY